MKLFLFLALSASTVFAQIPIARRAAFFRQQQAAGGGAYTAGTASFDGSQNLTLTPTGASDAKTGTISVWVKMGIGTDSATYDISRYPFLIRRNSDNTVRVLGYDPSIATAFDVQTTATITVASGWVNILIAFDLAAATVQVYIGDTDGSPSAGTRLNVNIGYSNGWQIPGTSSPFVGCEAEFWCDQTYRDLSVAGNRSIFHSGTLHPVSLSGVGAPVVYLKGDGTGYNINSGTYGNFTTTGTLTTCGTTP